MKISKPKLLIIDDDENILNQLKWALSDQYEILLAENAETAIKIFRKEHPCLVALDLGLPPAPRDVSEGLSVLREILELRPETKVLIITGNMDKANALRAVGLNRHIDGRGIGCSCSWSRPIMYLVP